MALLTTYDIEKDKTYLILRSDNDETKLNWFRWVNNDDLIISAKFGSKYRGTRYYQTRLLSMRYDAVGVKPKEMLKRDNRSSHRTSQFQDNVIDYLRDDPEHILVAVDLEKPNLPSVYNFNIHTGRKTRVIKGKRKIRDWITDRQRQVRIGEAYDYDSGDVVIFERKMKTLICALYAENDNIPGIYLLGDRAEGELGVLLETYRQLPTNSLAKNKHVAKVKTPTLLVHGKEDRVVHVEQSQLYADELKDYDKPFKYVELESADHYLTMGSNRMRFFEELDAFLATYLQ